MKQNNSLLKQLVIPLTAGVGLTYFTWQMIRDVLSRGETMTFSMWVAVAVMAGGAVYGLSISALRYLRHRQAQQEEESAAREAAQTAPALARPIVTSCDRETLEGQAELFFRHFESCRKLLKQFKRETYKGSFEGFHSQLEEDLEALDEFETDEATMEALADAMLDLLEDDWRSRRVKAPEFSDQLLMAVYFVPALTYEEHDAGTAFAQALHRRWCGRFPGSAFVMGSHEEVCRGFEKKFGCFITTAICQAENKPDDCPELTALRSYRDNWLAHQEGGRELIARYYDIAPGIVAMIRLQADADQVVRSLREEYLDPCLLAISQNRNEDCLAIYRDMVETLSRRYCAE